MAELFKLNETIISKLAVEIARNIYPLPDIRDQFKLTIEEFDEAVKTPFFQTRLAEEIAVWNSPANARTRVGHKAATMVELALPEIHALLHDRTQPMAAKVAALQMAARWAGIEQNPNVKTSEDAADRRVKITINIATKDGESKSLSFEKEKVIEGEAVKLEAPNGA